MTGLLGIIMNANNLFDFGVCNFHNLKEELIDCPNRNKLPLNSESVICVVFPCKTSAVEKNPDDIFRLRRVASQMLQLTAEALRNAFGEYEFEWFLDGSPIPNVKAAALSGLGIIGDSGLLLTPQYGSFCFIGCIVTNLHIPETGDGEIKYCCHCEKCINLCPAQALSEQTGFDKAKCMKYSASVASKSNAFLMRQNTAVRGCNICREICPYNQKIGLADDHQFIKAAASPELMFTSDGTYNPMGIIGQEKFKPFPGEQYN